MPRFAANLTFLFTEVPLPDRFEAARAAGFDAVEVLFPYDDPPEALAARRRAAGLEQVLINLPPTRSPGGGFGLAAVPGEEARFRDDFRRGLDVAAVMEPRLLHITAGSAAGAEAEAVYLRNLAWAAGAAPQGLVLTIEPINPVQMPGYFLNDFGLAANVVETVDAPNLRLQFDAYHAQMIHGDVPGAWARWGHLAAHVQVAGVPGRHEPVKGEIDYPAFFARLDADGYSGRVSGEYHPAGTTEEGLGWMR